MDKKLLNKLLIELQQGDVHVIERIYDMTKASVYAMCLSVVKNTEDATDLTHNTYIKIREKINYYKPNTNGYAWILTMSKNISINEYNKRKRELVTDFNDQEYIESDNKVDVPDLPIFKIAKKILSKDELQIVTMYAVTGFKHKEIAQILNKPLGTVLWVYKNSLKKLKVGLKDIYER